MKAIEIQAARRVGLKFAGVLPNGTPLWDGDYVQEYEYDCILRYYELTGQYHPHYA